MEWMDNIVGGNKISVITGQAMTISSTSDWVYLRHTGTAPAGAVGLVPTFYIVDSTFSTGEYLDLSNILVEEAAEAVISNHWPSYFDGDSSDSKWEGTPNNSQSMQLASIASKNLIADSSFIYTQRENLSGAAHHNIQSYYSCPWRVIIDPVKNRCLEYITDRDDLPQGSIILPQLANAPGFQRRPVAQLGEQYTVSADIVAPSGMGFNFGFRKVYASHANNQDSNQGAFTGTGEWQRYSYTMTVTSDIVGYYLGMQLRTLHASLPPIGTTFKIANVQVEKSPVATAFEATRPDW